MSLANGRWARLRKSEMQNLTLCDELLNRSGNVLNRHFRVDPVLVKEVDVIGSQTLETSVHHPLDVLRSAVQTALLGQIKSELGRNLHFVAERLQRSADDGLAHIRAVHFSRVEECHTFA